MSALAGVWSRRVDPRIVENMLAAVAHRGQRVQTTQVGVTAMGARDGLVHATRGLVLVGDVRIDNRAELLAALRLPATATDAELLLAAYEAWDTACPARLLGDFAFVIGDQVRHRLFCARDPFGVKPFYYHSDGDGGLAFATRIASLFQVPGVPREIDPDRTRGYLEATFDDPAATLYRGIHRLPPAHTLTLVPGMARIQRYWHPADAPDIRYASDDDYAAALRDIFVEAVRCRLGGAGPFGALLSGGLDSSSIVSVARLLLEQRGAAPLHTFSATFESVPECDERPFIQSIIAGGGVSAHFVAGDRLDPFDDLDHMLDAEDEVPCAPNLFVHWALYRAAREAGVCVLFDGLDGDTAISHGVSHITQLARNGRIGRAGIESVLLARRLGQPVWTVMRRRMVAPFVPDFVRRALGRPLPPATARARTEREDHAARLTSPLVPMALEIADRASAAWRIEARYPFFDRRIADFCIGLPPEQKLRDGWTRYILRRAMDGILPRSVQWRGGKSSLAPNFVRAVRHGLDRRPFMNPADLRLCNERRWSHADALALWRHSSLHAWLSRQEQPTPPS